MPSIPLLTHPHPHSIVAWRGGRPITRRTFLVHARTVADRFPAGRHILNVCTDRYRFAVTLVAGLLAERVNLLPPAYTHETVRQLAAFAPDAFVVSDSTDQTASVLPRCDFPDALPAVDDGPDDVPAIPADRLTVWVFTSGSTGAPVPHPKTWGKLVLNATNAAARLRLTAPRMTAPFTLVGTVPAQHMYGFESTVLLALLAGGAFIAERPLFPADVYAAVAAAPRPRVLVSTPFHLRNMLAAEAEAPAADLVLSATAPLSADLATQVEAAFAAPSLEIYGSTETGQIATRRPGTDSEWQLLPGVGFEDRGGTIWASGGHVEAPVPMGDIIVTRGRGRFTLGGRNADLVNIAGKRTSLAYLNHQLQDIAGVVDGAFYMPDENAGGVTRLAAFVVAPDLAPADILAFLRQRVDPLFLPRPLVRLARLPRNAIGKLPRETLREILAAYMANQDSHHP